MMPWESPPTPRPAPLPPGKAVPPPYTYVPAPVPPYQPPQVVAVNEETGQRVPVDLSAVIKQAIDTAIVENKQQIVANAEAARDRARQPRPKPKQDFETQTVEQAFESGQVTALTFVRGISLDIGVSLVAAFATIANGPEFSVFDKDIWTTIIPALVAKTLVQTFMSYAMKVKLKHEN